MSKAQALYRLQVLEAELKERSNRLEALEARLGESEELRWTRESVRTKEEEISSWRSKLRALEMDNKSLSEKIKTNEQQLYSGRIRNPKELSSMEEEVQYLERRRAKLEDEILETMLQIEEGETELEGLRQNLAQVEEKWQKEQLQLSSEREEIKTRLSQIEKERERLLEAISDGDLKLYEDLCRRKGGRGVALLKGGICQGCGVALPTSEVQRVRSREELNTCSSCGRILYSE
ncbi:MAG: zinc ribbon domain-containing protein [Anaerolineae bacterium]